MRSCIKHTLNESCTIGLNCLVVTLCRQFKQHFEPVLNKTMQNSDLGTRAFSNPAQYDRNRPSYSRETVQMFLKKFDHSTNSEDVPQQIVLELGAGTGMFTEIMVDVFKGSNVKIIASDPKESMCQAFRQKLPDISMRKFPAQRIELPDRSVHAIVAANALHWFSKSQNSLDEISRVLVPGGMFGVFWYHPDFRIPWIADIVKYMAPLYQHQGTVLAALHKDHFLEPVRQCGYFHGEEEARHYSVWHAGDHEAVLDMFLTRAVFTASDEKTKNAFQLFFQETIDKHFTSKKEILEAVPFEEAMFWFKKKVE